MCKSEGFCQTLLKCNNGGHYKYYGNRINE